MSPRFVLGRENVPCVAEVVNRSFKADCTDVTTDPLIVTIAAAVVLSNSRSSLDRHDHRDRTSLYLHDRH